MFWFHFMKGHLKCTQRQYLKAYECETVEFRDLVSRMAGLTLFILPFSMHRHNGDKLKLNILSDSTNKHKRLNGGTRAAMKGKFTF